jgi:anthranilate phosphoribosyltransferase
VSFQKALHQVLARESLTSDEARDAFSEIMEGSVSPIQLSAFLAALRVKGETVAELTGAAEAMIDAAIPLKVQAPLILDCCGTGGDGQSSFNVSSAAACVLAGAGYTVAKHGNRSVSSKSGSADVFEAYGVSLEAEPALIQKILEQNGFAFLFAQAFHPAMKHAAPVRRELGTRTIFNLLGPLTNPARPNIQLVGVFAPEWLEPIAQALVALGCRQGAVVHGDGHDELVLSGTNQVILINDGRIERTTWKAEDFGLKENPKALIPGATARENALMLEDILKGRPGVLHDVVCMNAAVLIQAASRIERPGRAYSLPEAFDVARTSISRGTALAKLERLKEMTRLGAAA